ncbi:MAG: TonB family protein [Acinetobacter populi]|jgi:protein TonB|uniref:TonB family protein n=1 Tax=Acinetobacter populi TaxID=1582270 RepID=UPI002356FFD5|nr:TonB family protein [Acinetobacter populi]MCH4248053.1 TonB family protein [Acinetobacter populi]
MYYLDQQRSYSTPMVKKSVISTVALVLVGHLGGIWLLSNFRAPELVIHKKEPIQVHFVKIPAPSTPSAPLPDPPIQELKPEPQQIPKPEVKPKEVKTEPKIETPPKKVEKVQSVKEMVQPKKVVQQQPVTEQHPVMHTIDATPVVTNTQVQPKEPVVEKVTSPTPVNQPAVEVSKPSASLPVFKTVEIGGTQGVQWSRQPKISYEPDALKGQNRIVVLQIEANEKGEITNVRVMQSSGVENLDQIVMRAVRKAKLKPYVEGGVTYPVRAQQPFQLI